MNSGFDIASDSVLAVIARVVPKPLKPLREAFQRGLGDAATCVLARLAFDDSQGAPVLVFYVTLPGESAPRAFGDQISSDEKVEVAAAEERGAALRTAIQAGLIRRHHET